MCVVNVKTISNKRYKKERMKWNYAKSLISESVSAKEIEQDNFGNGKFQVNL